VTKSITLEVRHPTIPDGKIQGFRFMWAYYVNGYKPETHCQKCFTGRRVEEFSTRTASSGSTIAFDDMDSYPYVYVCGVGEGPKPELRTQNLHLPMKFKEGGVVEVTTYNGYVFRAENAEEVPIPPLPDDWMGLDREHARCKNFQFAVACFGSPASPAEETHRQGGAGR
jgi:hypothetical protein